MWFCFILQGQLIGILSCFFPQVILWLSSCSHIIKYLSQLLVNFERWGDSLCRHCSCLINACLIVMKQSKLEWKHSRMDVNGWITAVGWKTSCVFLAGPRSECVSFVFLSSRQRSITETGPVILMSKRRQQQGNIVFGYVRRQRDH